jgi:hypothetical protein
MPHKYRDKNEARLDDEDFGNLVLSFQVLVTFSFEICDSLVFFSIPKTVSFVCLSVCRNALWVATFIGRQADRHSGIQAGGQTGR